MHILGLSGLEHDTAAALLTEKGIEVAIEEAKLARTRKTSGIPHSAIGFCLRSAKLEWDDVDYIAVATRPIRAWARHAWLRARRLPVAPLASAYYQTKGLGELSRELNHHRILRALAHNPGSRVLSLDHHLCHAASAFYASPFDRAVILTLDERGDGCSGQLAVGEGDQIHVLRAIAFPHSLGWVYSQITELLGFTQHSEEHKTQWLSLEGEPTFQAVFLDMLRRASTALPRLDFSYFNPGLTGNVSFSTKFYRRLGLDWKEQRPFGETLRRQIASSVQHACETIVTQMAEWLRGQAQERRNLCLAGGLFLNPLLVQAVERSGLFDQVFVQPAASNEGCALGAAWLVWHQVLRNPRVEPMSSLYWGPSFASEEIKQVLDNCKTRYRWCQTDDHKIDETIRLLEAAKIVAWYQGAAEFGPRALGNRSLLASPWVPYVKENLNDYVKHREPFRPFAIAIPEEDAPRYFQYSPLARFMTSLATAKPAARELLEGFLLPGNRLRLHVVGRRVNPLFWRLLKRFGDKSPAPMLVNTSFNLFGEPLVTRPREAIRTFFCSGIDALVAGNFLLTK